MLFLLAKHKSELLIVNHYCHFHPNSPAKWRCNECNKLYDNACLPKCNEKLQQATCPFCNKALRFLPANSDPSNDIYPTKRLLLDSLDNKNIALTAASFSASLLISVVDFNVHLTLLSTLCFSLFLALHFSRESAYYRHLFEQTGKRRAVYRGKSHSFSLSTLSVKTSIQLTLSSTFLMLLPTYVFYMLHWFPGLILLIFAGISLPYLIIFSLHSSDNEPTISLNKLFKEIKPFTSKLSLVSLGLFWLTLFVSDLLASFWPMIVAIGASAFLTTINTIVIINLACKVFIISERKLSAKKTTLEKTTGPGSIYRQEAVSTLDTDIDQALKTGQYNKAVSLLEDALKRNSTSNLRRQQLFLLLYELQDLEKLSRYAELFLNWMLERNNVKDASQFIYKLRKHDPKFLLHHVNLMNLLAKKFLRAKKHALVLWLAEDAKTRHKPSEDLASLYLSAAQALITHFKDLEKSEEYLLFILQSCGEYPSADAAKALLIHLQHNQKKQQDLRSE